MATGKPTANGKFFSINGNKLYLKGLSYGPFREASHGHQFPEKDQVARDFSMMQEAGVNCIRTYTAPPLWLLDLAGEWNLWVMAGIPWAQHVAFLDSRAVQRDIRAAVTAVVEECKGHRALFSYLIGNEIPADIVRWHGANNIQRFLRELADLVRRKDPGALVSYANFPSTEYLEIDFVDFYCFNVYLHSQESFQKYLARLQNLANTKPLVLSEFGADSIREGEEGQAHILEQKLKTSLEMGAAGTVVFSWTDEWFTGGHDITDWAFGVVTSGRQPKSAFEVVRRYYKQQLPPLPEACPKISVVVCAYNAERTIDSCLAALQKVRYPNYEVIVVNDGSNDGTLDICQRYPFIQLICQENEGLGVARNVGLEAASGEIVAYTDADCDVDPDWLTYLVHSFQITGKVAVGGPNLPPPEDALVPSAVAVSPGGPTHVLLDDLEAEHIAGCNMAFRTDVLKQLGGFDLQFRAAGDDVDICWRIQDAGYSIGFSPAAQVWHFRRHTVRDYFNQQKGYGKAEAMVYLKHPDRFNQLGQASWLGRIYGDFNTALVPGKPFIYSGIFGMAPFQSLYLRPESLWGHLPQTLEWLVFSVLILFLGVIHKIPPLISIAPITAMLASSMVAAWRAPVDPRFRGLRSRFLISYLIFLAPIARSWERYKRRIQLGKANRYTAASWARKISNQNGSRPPSCLGYWSNQGVTRDRLLSNIIDRLKERKLIISVENGWAPIDFRVTQGILTTCKVVSATENHGGYDLLHRIRCTFEPAPIAILSSGVLTATLCAAIYTKNLYAQSIIGFFIVALAAKYFHHRKRLLSAVVLATEESAANLQLSSIER